jgi:hypothetical protein
MLGVLAGVALMVPCGLAQPPLARPVAFSAPATLGGAALARRTRVSSAPFPVLAAGTARSLPGHPVQRTGAPARIRNRRLAALPVKPAPRGIVLNQPRRDAHGHSR